MDESRLLWTGSVAFVHWRASVLSGYLDAKVAHVQTKPDLVASGHALPWAWHRLTARSGGDTPGSAGSLQGLDSSEH